MAFRTKKISQMDPKGSNLASTDLLEISELVSGSYVTKSITGAEIIASVPPTTVEWGDIGGTLSSQTDLNTALNAKVTGNTAITGATKTKVTYDSKGLVTAGADATTADIADSTNKRYVTDANLTVIGNTSGTNTGDQTLSGLGGVPTTRTLTINGTTQDLSADRTFTISTGITIGTTAITSGTVGRVLFEGTGNVVQESANLFWDNTNGYLGSGTSSPLAKIHAIGGVSNTFKAQSTAADMYNQFISTSGTGEFGIYQDSFYFQALTSLSNGIQFLNGTTGVMKFTQTGNLLINTTTDAGFKLDVNGTFRVSSGANALLDVSSTLTTLNRNLGTAQAMRGFSVTPTSDTRAFGTSTNYGTMSVGDGTNFAVLGYNWSPTGAKAVFAGITAAGNQLPIALYGRKFELYNQSNVAMTMFDTTANFVVQTGGTHTDVASSKFTINSTTQGFLPPRMDTTQKNAIASPATGLMVYDTTLNLISVYNGTTWITL